MYIVGKCNQQIKLLFTLIDCYISILGKLHLGKPVLYNVQNHIVIITIFLVLSKVNINVRWDLKNFIFSADKKTLHTTHKTALYIYIFQKKKTIYIIETSAFTISNRFIESNASVQYKTCFLNPYSTPHAASQFKFIIQIPKCFWYI